MVWCNYVVVVGLLLDAPWQHLGNPWDTSRSSCTRPTRPRRLGCLLLRSAWKPIDARAKRLLGLSYAHTEIIAIYCTVTISSPNGRSDGNVAGPVAAFLILYIFIHS